MSLSKLKRPLLLLPLLCFFACTSNNEVEENNTERLEVPASNELALAPAEASFSITPIEHATAVFNWENITFYIDPVGGKEAFAAQLPPDVILVTDIHGDHLNVETLSAVATSGTAIVVPKAVADKLPQEMQPRLSILNNGESLDMNGFSIEAVPMYNLRPEALKFHEKGRGNGYVIERDGMRVYFSGDTEDIPEMRDLEDINKAFVCMNLPYTMPVTAAADAVVEFSPDQVYPYHYRGTDGLADVEEFKRLVNETNPNVEVVQLNWYPNKL